MVTDSAVSETPTDQQTVSRCTLCPAGCPLSLTQTAPDMWRSEYPLADSPGLCPRGAVLGELLCHRRRILAPARRAGGALREVDFQAALQGILARAGDRSVALFLDGNVPCEQMASAIAWAEAWPSASLCLAVEPADEEMLLGTEAGGADYLANDALAECDGFVIIGDAFSADPICSRGVFDRRAEHPRTPIVAIDPGFGLPSKFASHHIDVAPGGELGALLALAASAGVALEGVAAPASDSATDAAGEAVAKCERLGVLVAAEFGRCGQWRQIGYVAGLLAKARGGGVSPQTVGANALAAVRLSRQHGLASLTAALADDNAVRIALGCDVLAMTGRDCEFLAAAAALPNCTTDAAEFVLPCAMAGEMAGTFMLAGERTVGVAAVLPAPAGVPAPGDIVGLLAKAAGVEAPQTNKSAGKLARCEIAAPKLANSPPASSTPALLLGRQAIHSGCAELTRHASWACVMQPLPQLRVSPADAEAAGAKNFSEVSACVGAKCCRAQVRIAPELPSGVMVLPEWHAAARSLLGGADARGPVTVEVTK